MPKRLWFFLATSVGLRATGSFPTNNGLPDVLLPFLLLTNSCYKIRKEDFTHNFQTEKRVKTDCGVSSFSEKKSGSKQL